MAFGANRQLISVFTVTICLFMPYLWVLRLSISNFNNFGNRIHFTINVNCEVCHLFFCLCIRYMMGHLKICDIFVRMKSSVYICNIYMHIQTYIWNQVCTHANEMRHNSKITPSFMVESHVQSWYLSFLVTVWLF